MIPIMTRSRLAVAAVALAALAVVVVIISAKMPSMLASRDLSMLDAAMLDMQIGFGIAGALGVAAVILGIVGITRR